MAGKTNTKQICVFKTQKMLLEFMDDTRYEREPMAWPHTPMSRIRIHAKDYSEGTGELAVDSFYNLSPDEFHRLYLAVQKARTSMVTEFNRAKRHLDRLLAIQKSQSQSGNRATGLQEIQDIAEQFASSSNELFSEAGEKLEKAISSISVTQASNPVLEKMIREATAELNELKTSRDLYTDLKILNYDKYANPENEAERTVTQIKVLYCPQMNYPYAITVANGWGIPQPTKSKGVIIKEGSTRFTHTVHINMDEKALLPMLRRVDLFLQAMTAHSLTRYYETVTNPVLYYQMNGEE